MSMTGTHLGATSVSSPLNRAVVPRAAVVIRAATRRAVVDLIRLARRMHAESAYSGLPFDEAKVGAAMQTAFSRPQDHFAAMAEIGGELVGYLGGALGTYPFCDEILAHDLGFYVAPEHRRSSAAARLARAFVAWARHKGAREVQLAVSSGVDVERIGAFYERLGLNKVGGIYRASLR